ncbi:MAG: hypothetical protein AB1635_18920 [Acidobacteriota bacterium]
MLRGRGGCAGRIGIAVVTATWALAGATPAWAQHDHAAAPDPSSDGWTWSASARVFLNGNLQIKKFRDFRQVESQNWFMAAGRRRAGAGELRVFGMASLEPFTLRRLGSAQTFQTGETLDGAPLIDYQHPHELLMGLGARYERPLGGRARLALGGGLVDAPALGPTPFMHRASADMHPTAPLSHHNLDASHTTFAVVTAGLGAGPWLVEASAFHGGEPDEHRTDIADLGALDSWSARVSWSARGWRLQASGARVHEPEVVDPGDQTRLRLSIEYAGQARGRDVALTLAWGDNRERFGNEAGWLVELAMSVGRRGVLYSRSEIVDKHILEAGGLHPPGFEHPHELSLVGALTGGYVHEAVRGRWGALAVGGDVTGHRTPANLWEPYGRPWSVHLYARWSAGAHPLPARP